MVNALLVGVVLIPACRDRAGAEVSDGAAITPEFAKGLYDQFLPLREPDGCRLTRFDTSRFRIAVGLQAPSGTEHVLEFATITHRGGAERRVGDWMLSVPAELERDCAATVAAMQRVLHDTDAPQGSWFGTSGITVVVANYSLLALCFVLLVLGTLHILYRETTLHRPSPYAVAALFLVWAVALALRLSLSPRTFLHEYYHIAETVAGYLKGEIGPAYGNAGPALYRFAGAVFGRPDDLRVIFLTNAVIASLAVPAVALLDLALIGSWPRALCAAVLLCVLPQHLRFSAAEDLFVVAVTFGLWSLALFALYLRTRRLEDVLCAAIALSLAMQSRPEMLFFPAVVLGMLVLTAPGAWRVLLAWRSLVAFLLLAVLLIPRFVDFLRALQDSPPGAALPPLERYLRGLVLFQPQVTPPIYLVLLAAGLLWGIVRRPGFTLWVVAVYVGYTLFSLSVFDNPPFNLRAQILPTAFVVLIAAGAASAWLGLAGRYRRQALVIGAGLLAAVAVGVVLGSRPFVTELRDQQLEWAFLERTVPLLPERATLLTAVDVGPRRLDAFPQFLLQRASKRHEMIDVQRVASGEVAWPNAGDDVLYYQGMFCYFAFDDEASPDPITATCQAVHDRYVTEPLFVEDLHTKGYSRMRYARDGQGPYRIGFYRLKAAR
jgi:hypothetical protein